MNESEALTDAIANGREADAVAKHGVVMEHTWMTQALRAECARFVEHAAPVIEQIKALAWDEGALAFSQGKGSEANPYARPVWSPDA